VRYQSQLYSQPGALEEGDCLLSNHPSAGGSHLPDCTVIVPTFHNGKVVFWTAARAHHVSVLDASAVPG
jgi:5-oxoprolinase (ATP-hydrolysing)